MNRQSQLAVARELQRHIRARTTDLAPAIFRNPVSVYSDPARAYLERERLFQRSPVFMGLSSRLPNPGDFLTEEIAGAPILLVRTQDGSLQAFANICRHRGAPVARGGGSARVFACPYHGWTYDLGGRLIGIPEEASFTGVDKPAHGLQRLPVGERYGLMFARTTPAAQGESLAIDVETFLGSLGPELGDYGFDRYSLFASEVLTHAMNWKFGIDTFLESYHLPSLHRTTVGPLIHGNVAVFARHGDHSCVTAVRFTASEWEAQPEADWNVLPHIVPIYRLFPNSIVVFQSDHLETWRMFPGDRADQCTVEFALYTPEPAVTEKARNYWHKNYDLAIRTVKQEDFLLGEQMQRGFMSGLQREVIYGRNEPALGYFHERLQAALGSA